MKNGAKGMARALVAFGVLLAALLLAACGGGDGGIEGGADTGGASTAMAAQFYPMA